MAARLPPIQPQAAVAARTTDERLKLEDDERWQGEVELREVSRGWGWGWG
jgi:hypothetical protein